MNNFGWHVTTLPNWQNIRRTGLFPQIGPRSQSLRESEPAIYLFKSQDEAIDGITNWLGDELENECDNLVLLKIDLSEIKEIDNVGFEYIVSEPIDSSKITFIANI